jgi:hypothetical protein
MKVAKVFLAFGSFVAAVALLPTGTASAAWSGLGCAPGYMCLFHGPIASSEARGTTTTDTNLSDNFWVIDSSTSINDYVVNTKNRRTSGGMRVNTAASGAGTWYACLPAGMTQRGLPRRRELPGNLVGLY